MPRRKQASEHDRHRAIAYVRGLPGLPVDDQVARIATGCADLGFEIVATVEETDRDTVPVERRRGLRRALDSVGTLLAGTLVMVEPAVVSTITAEFAAVTEVASRWGAEVRPLAAYPTDLDATVSELRSALVVLEALQRGRRVRAGVDARREQGLPLGGAVPYGWRRSTDGQRLEEHPQEQATVRLVGELRGRRMSYRQIADELEQRGLRNRNGGRFSPQTVKNLAARAKEEG